MHSKMCKILTVNNGSVSLLSHAILTALIVGLGGKATITNRATSLKGFVKYEESFADIKVKLKNRGNDPYKGDIYGDSICIEHRITSDGSRTCKIKNKTGHVISTKKEELTAILDHFGIQVDNPVSIINQEMSKQFLHSKSEADKYKFFMKATLLEQMKRDYIHIKQTKALTREQVERQEECLKDLRQLFLQKKERYERLSSLDNMRQNLEDLKKKMAWCLVRYFSASCRSVKSRFGRRSHETEQAQHQQKISAFKKQLEKLEEESSTLNQEIKDKQQSKLKRKKQLMASRSNRLRRFGNHMPELLESINKAFSQGRFIKKPVGPIGACISLKDPSLAVAVESCLRGLIKSFCCDNYRDEKVLQGLMSSYFPRSNRPQIIVCLFTDRVYNLQGRGVQHPEFLSVLDCLNIENPVITNCLIDMRSIESILIIKNARARKVMQGSRPPKNCREAFTADGDQVYTNRYYTTEREVLAQYLGGDPEAEIRQKTVILNCKNISKCYCFCCTLDQINFSLVSRKDFFKKHKKYDLSLREEETQDCEAKAKEICPVRQQVGQSAKSIDAEITRLRQKISTEESSHGDKEQVIREYAEAHSNYKSKSSQLRDLRKFIDRLDHIMIDRQDRYKSMRRSLSVRCKLYFINYMMELKCCGSIMFDHNNETLSISVKPLGQEENNVNDMRSLSGGERSFSTVCFILALWEITESPFRCLDEFDVYMDMHNRNISMNMLVALSEDQHQRQFIFITPQSTSHLPNSSHITIHQLQDPEREAEEEGDVC
uniref:Structural maintenance of chromosomes protein 6-like n=1 Tax=Sinocyclocheilus grahami TaxID=75366 RepID=A0A672TGB0_SINGR